MNIPSPQSADTRSERELVALAKAGDAEAFTELTDRFMPTLHSRAGRYSNIVGVDVEDFIQEGMLALYRAVKGYDGRAGIQFSTYAITCINNSMASAIKSHMKNYQKGANINIDEIDEHKLFQQTTLRTGDLPPEDIFIDQETRGFRARQIETLLSEFERHVLKLYLSGQPYQRIAEILSTSTKAVDNALQRVRRKLRPDF